MCKITKALQEETVIGQVESGETVTVTLKNGHIVTIKKENHEQRN